MQTGLGYCGVVYSVFVRMFYMFVQLSAIMFAAAHAHVIIFVCSFVDVIVYWYSPMLLIILAPVKCELLYCTN
jgi:hypothetical protein